MLPIVETLDIPEKPTSGQLDDRMTAMFSKDRRPDDGMLHVGHWRNSVLSKKGQGELMGSICCTQIPFILIMINQSHCSPLSLLYSADPLVDLKTHTSTSTVELFFVVTLTTPYAFKSMFHV